MKRNIILWTTSLLLYFTVSLGNAFAASFSVVLDWFINPTHAPLLVAKEQGYFKEEGLDVHLIPPADPSDGPKMVAVGRVDMAIDYEPQALVQVSRGLPLIRVGSLIDQPLACILVLKSSHITSLTDLKGTSVGVPISGYGNAIAQRMLEYHGLSLHDVHVVNVKYDLSQALIAKRITAATGMMRNFEPIQLRLAGAKTTAFFPEKNGVPPYEELIFVVKKGHQYDENVKKFLRAFQKGVAYLKAHPKASWHHTVQQYPELNNTLNREAWSASLPYFSLAPSHYNARAYGRFAQFLVQEKLIPKALSTEKYGVDPLKKRH